MSQSTLKLMKFLAGTRGEGYSRARAARACCMSERSVDNALRSLISLGAIARKRGGRSTSSKITVFMNLEEFIAHQVRIARQVVDDCALNGKTCALSAKSCALNGPVLNNARASETQTQKKEGQHQHADVEPSLSEEIRKAAGFEALSESDRRYLATLAASGVSAAAIRAGVLVGRARNHGRQKIRSLRYFANVISDAARGAFPEGYVEYVEHRLEHYEKQQPFEHERASYRSGELGVLVEAQRKPPGAELELREMFYER